MMAGRPVRSSARRASSMPRTSRLRGQSRPIRAMASRNRSLSSALSMASRPAPMSSVPWRSRTPRLARVSAVLSAVWPPMVGSRAQGFSFSMILAVTSGVIGSI